LDDFGYVEHFHPSVFAAASAGDDGRRAFISGKSGSMIVDALYDAGQFVPLCVPGHDVGACPCQNSPLPGGLRGCQNSALTGGARLDAVGVASVDKDTMSLTASDVIPHALSFFVQGDSLGEHPSAFGRGLSCVQGNRLLYTANASASGRVTAPLPGASSISQRSLDQGDAILAGSKRWYFVYYRDAGDPNVCVQAAPFNTTPAIQALWAP
jgi:hypothetical protein